MGRRAGRGRGAWSRAEAERFDVDAEERERIELLAAGIDAAAPDDASAFWLRPAGHATDVLVSVVITALEGAPAPSFAEMLDGAETAAGTSVEAIRTDALGVGMSFRRPVAIHSGSARPAVVLETTAIFLPPGYVVVLDARSMDPAHVAVLDLHLGELLEGIRVPGSLEAKR